MNARTEKTRQRTSRAHRLGGLLLALLFVAQPALALVQMQCGESVCGSSMQGCCCVEAPAQAPPAKSCCASEETVPVEEEQIESEPCRCKLGSDSLPNSQPVPPLSERAGSSEFALMHWVRDHAQLSAVTSCGPPVLSQPPRGCARTDDFVPGMTTQLESAWSATDSTSSSACWRLLACGAPGLLALFSIALL